jgi:hypothetical protein
MITDKEEIINKFGDVGLFISSVTFFDGVTVELVGISKDVLNVFAIVTATVGECLKLSSYPNKITLGEVFDLLDELCIFEPPNGTMIVEYIKANDKRKL